MSIDPKQFRYDLVRPILKNNHLWSPSAEELVLGTAAVESGAGKYIVQLDNGPALGIFQMEPRTYTDVRKIVVPRFKKLTFEVPLDENDLVWDLRLALIMCRLQYWRFKEPLPASNDIHGLANYHKKYYNTILGKTDPDKFIWCHNKYIGDP